jgi:NTE family protein
MNAAVAADGVIAGGPEGARARLSSFWRAVGDASGAFAAAPSAWVAFWRSVGAPESAGFAAFDAMLRAASPYDLNPLNLHPLKEIVEAHVDFDRLRRARNISVYVSATDVLTGTARVFKREELSADVLLASACLPALFHAVEIDGTHYWDGGYAANPPLLPLLSRGSPRDVVIAPLNPMRRPDTPRSADDIAARVNEITFNASCLGELKAIGLAKRLARSGIWGMGWLGSGTGLGDRARAMRLHMIDADGALAGLSGYSKLQSDAASLLALRDRGRAIAATWLDGPGRSVGRRATLDVEATFAAGEEWAR